MKSLAQIRRTLPASLEVPAQSGFALIPNQRLLEIYAAMVRCRLLTKAAAGQPGHEAAVAGSVLALGAGDAVLPLPGEPCAAFLNGAPLTRLLKPTKRKPAPAKMAAAMAGAKLRMKAGKGRVVVMFLGPMSEWPADWRALLRKAVKHRLPLIAVCLAGAPALNPFGQEPEADARPLGLATIPVDRHDAPAIYRVTTEAVTHARKGNGPTVIDCRLWEPSGEAIDAPDAVTRMEDYLNARGILLPQIKTSLTRGFGREARAAMAEISA